ncbi:MAG: EFR1 family ferrodoxin [Bacilli bacterium]|jgi:ferredoxin
MNFLFLLFSGTNNTYEIARLLANDFGVKGHQTQIIKIDIDTPAIDLSEYDYVGFGYPIYAFNEPRFFWRYIKKLILPTNVNYFIFKTSGETLALNNVSSRRILRRLRRNNCRVLGDYHFVMPYNIHFRFDDAFVKEILNYNRKLSRILVASVLRGHEHFLPSSFIYNFVAWVIGIQRLGATINSHFYRADMAKCIKCNKCIRDCPVHNVYDKGGKIAFHHHCQMCMRCSFYCPSDAISIGYINSWRVNGAYRFAEIEKNSSLKLPYITPDSKGFYRCFIRYFADIDRRYEELSLRG